LGQRTSLFHLFVLVSTDPCSRSLSHAIPPVRPVKNPLTARQAGIRARRKKDKKVKGAGRGRGGRESPRRAGKGRGEIQIGMRFPFWNPTLLLAISRSIPGRNALPRFPPCHPPVFFAFFLPPPIHILPPGSARLVHAAGPARIPASACWPLGFKGSYPCISRSQTTIGWLSGGL